ncbi:hypothetical protein NCAS_0D04370 [Naumovozyma castellii]|uniref:Uncharacterized protein n=1 Tax=Naumovozyma castellii TaxID=27288 RepID=G0VEM7_NAUCA|nr:hypothetical protein NCAS_0D04370 [Naumovozyma castellii CBS 4309]CCC70018.1 hypothetical protein NCAS_0D04370 [Naumovozyma castellii CBS 4309]
MDSPQTNTAAANRPLSAHLTIHYQNTDKKSPSTSASRDNMAPSLDSQYSISKNYTAEKKERSTSREVIRTILNIGTADTLDDEFVLANSNSNSNSSLNMLESIELPSSSSRRPSVATPCPFLLLTSDKDKTVTRLSTYMNIYDLYQCVPQSNGNHHSLKHINNHKNTQFIARRFSDPQLQTITKDSLPTSLSFTTAKTTSLKNPYSMEATPRSYRTNDPILHVNTSTGTTDTTTNNGIPSSPPPFLSASASSLSGSNSSFTTTTNTSSQQQQHNNNHNMNPFIDISSPCSRHHHRRNSIALKFEKPLYKNIKSNVTSQQRQK